uniref:Secreted protein n=1 Tax=Mesocestoides corti TaxID=53468 RepID=A0A5K3FJW4_MESCO
IPLYLTHNFIFIPLFKVTHGLALVAHSDTSLGHRLLQTSESVSVSWSRRHKLSRQSDSFEGRYTNSPITDCLPLVAGTLC